MKKFSQPVTLAVIAISVFLIFIIVQNHFQSSAPVTPSALHINGSFSEHGHGFAKRFYFDIENLSSEVVIVEQIIDLHSMWSGVISVLNTNNSYRCAVEDGVTVCSLGYHVGPGESATFGPSLEAGFGGDIKIALSGAESGLEFVQIYSAPEMPASHKQEAEKQYPSTPYSVFEEIDFSEDTFLIISYNINGWTDTWLAATTPDSPNGVRPVFQLNDSERGYSKSESLIFENKIYVSVGELNPSAFSYSVVKIIDPFEGSIQNVAIDGNIINLFLSNDTVLVYHTAGASKCIDSPNSISVDGCHSAITKISSDGTAELFASSIPTAKRGLYAVSHDTNTLLLEDGYGDGGFFYTALYAYNRNEDSLEEVRRWDDSNVSSVQDIEGERNEFLASLNETYYIFDKKIKGNSFRVVEESLQLDDYTIDRNDLYVTQFILK